MEQQSNDHLFLTTKLAIPPVRLDLVPRIHLFQKLEACLEHPGRDQERQDRDSREECPAAPSPIVLLQVERSKGLRGIAHLQRLTAVQLSRMSRLAWLN